MSKKKAIKIMAATAMAASTFAAVAPTQADAASKVPGLVKDAKAAMKKPYTTYIKGSKYVERATVQKEVKAAEKAYAAAKKAVNASKYSAATKKRLLKEMKGYEKYVSYAKRYDAAALAAHRAGVALNKEVAKLNGLVEKDDLAAVQALLTKIKADAKAADAAIVKGIVGKNPEKQVKARNTVPALEAVAKFEKDNADFLAGVAKVTSVSAINGKELLVKFNKAVDETTAISTASYSFSDTNSVASAELQEDGKSVVLTLTNAYSNTSAHKVAVTVEGVILDGTVDETFPIFTSVVSINDVTKAEISSVSSVTRTNSATSITVNFSEPINTGAAFKVNGVSASVTSPYNPGVKSVTLSVPSGLAVGTTHKVEAVNLTDLSGNVNAVASRDFTVTQDVVAPLVSSVVAQGDNQLLVTFSKNMKNDSAARTVLENNIKVKNDVYGDVTVTSVTPVNGTSRTQFVVQLDRTQAENLYSTTKTSHNLTVLFVDNTIEDYLGNKVSGTTTTTTITKDTVAPEVTGVTYKKNSAGQVTSVVVSFSEGVKENTTLAFPTSMVNENGVVVSTSSVLPSIAAANVRQGAKTAEFAITPTVITGQYSVAFTAGWVKDTSLAENNSKAYNAVINFGAAQVAGDYTIAASTVTSSGSTITVVFPEAVKGGAVAGSATDASRYTINGRSLPVGTTITLNAAGNPSGSVAQTIATITLPDQTIDATDTAAIFTINGVQSLTGKTNKSFTKAITVLDNVSPTLVSAKVLDNKTVELTYNEAMASVSGADVGLEFRLFEGTTAITLTDSQLTASSVAGFPTKLRLTVNKGTDTPGTPASTFATATNLTAASGNVGTGTVTVTGTFTGTANETLTVAKTATGFTVNGTDDVTLTGSTFTYKGLTLDTAGLTNPATNDSYSIALAAAVAPTSATVLDLTKDLFVQTLVPTSGVDVKDTSALNNTQKADVKISISK